MMSNKQIVSIDLGSLIGVIMALIVFKETEKDENKK